MVFLTRSLVNTRTRKERGRERKIISKTTKYKAEPGSKSFPNLSIKWRLFGHPKFTHSVLTKITHFSTTTFCPAQRIEAAKTRRKLPIGEPETRGGGGGCQKLIELELVITKLLFCLKNPPQNCYANSRMFSKLFIGFFLPPSCCWGHT